MCSSWLLFSKCYTFFDTFACGHLLHADKLFLLIALLLMKRVEDGAEALLLLTVHLELLHPNNSYWLTDCGLKRSRSAQSRSTSAGCKTHLRKGRVLSLRLGHLLPRHVLLLLSGRRGLLLLHGAFARA